MFNSLEYEIKKQNELLQRILDRGGLGVVLEDIEPIRPKNYMDLDGQDYDKAKRQVSANVSQRIAEIVNLYGEIKYLSQFIEERYKYFKQLKREAPKGVVHQDIENFIERYEEGCKE